MSEQKPNLDSLFEAAVEIESAEERAAFLDKSCGKDLELRGQLERLLQSNEQAGSFLDKPLTEREATILTDGTGENLAAALDAGLAPAFTGDQAIVIGDAGHSVLKMLGQTLDKVPRVALRDSVEEGADPIVRPKSAEMPKDESDSRYRLDGEIARGGMGAILKGRDTDLGRDLAIKVLLEAHKDKPEVVQRFVEEAQIGGQLQHPGIAPVYELGQFADKRPFFSMKLVKGETLSKLLADRKDSTAERGKFIGIFEQICQTMAYAHSRGVIHRDLKPANVMVGAFGEVQVMDWGLAKVLPAGGVSDEKTVHDQQQGQSVIQTLRTNVKSDVPGPIRSLGTFGSHTQMGSVMGTPAYMPPEQALGEIDRLDERSDVFGLGAILCEILTGLPPYVGSDGTRVYRMASRGQLDDAFTRLAACGADAELIALTKHCLELEPQNRPRDAGVLAKRVSGYLELVETKLRESERAKFDAQVRAEELRRRQKLAYSAGAAIAASLLIGLSVSLWQMQRATRAERVAIAETARATSEASRATAAFDELRATAPAFAEQARGLAAKEQYDDAIAKLDYAIKLRPDAAEFLVAKGDLLQCQLRLAPAAAIYRQALRVQPGLARAEDSAKLCEELLAAKPAADGKLSRESLAKLNLAMQKQQRPAAELLPVARLLGEERKLLLDYWLARLKDLPVSAENPLAKRLTDREDGRLALDLSGTKVTDLSPLADAPLAVLNLNGSTEVTDLTPLRAMQSLEELSVSETRVADLTPLNALRLKRLFLQSSQVTDLTPLQKMLLETLNLRDTRVTDLSPLIGMPIKNLWVDQTPVRDFSPLAQMPLERCYLSNTQITDLTVLRGRPLKELALHGCALARHYAVLAEIPTLETLLLPDTFRTLPDEDLAAIGALRTHPRLRQLQADIEEGLYYSATQSKDLFWQDWDRLQTFLPALRQTGFRLSRPLVKLPDGTYFLNIQNQPLSDLSIVKGAPISKLTASTCKITDLSPLRGLPLNYLNAAYNPITDLSPLRGMPLEELYVSGTKISDLSPLVGMPLKSLFLSYCSNVTDISPLLKIPTLEHLMVPVTARNVELLRKMPNLRTLDFIRMDGKDMFTIASTVDDFWKRWDAMAWKRALDAASVTYSAAGLTEQTREGTKSSGTWTVRIVSKDFSDCSVFQGAGDIRELNLANTAVTDLQPLRGLKLTTLVLPPNAQDIEFLRASSQLRRISFKEDPKTRQPAQTATEFWKDYDSQAWLHSLRASRVAIKRVRQLPDGTWDLDLSDAKISDLGHLKGAPISSLNLKNTAVTDLRPLHGLPLKVLRLDDTAVTDFRPLQGTPIEELDLRRVKITDLAVLRGMALTKLQLGDNAITDLEPLRGMALTVLGIPKTKVTDLSPLAGMSLEYLDLIGTPVTDISVVRGMPLTKVRLRLCAQLTDLSPLAETKGLTSLSLPPNPKDIEFLRAFPRLERLSFMEGTKDTTIPDKTAVEFWTDYDAKKH